LPNGYTSTLAGSGSTGSANGVGTSASFHTPRGLAVDSGGNVFVADNGNSLLRKITPTGVTTTFAGASGGANQITDVAIDSSGNIYTINYGDAKINCVSSTTGVITELLSFAVDGNLLSATYGVINLWSLTVDSTSTYLYFTGFGSFKIGKVPIGGGTVSSVPGASSLSNPVGLTFDSAGMLYVADVGTNCLVKISPSGTTSNVACGFRGIHGISLDAAGNMYVAEEYNNRVLVIFAASTITTCDSTWHHLALTHGDGS